MGDKECGVASAVMQFPQPASPVFAHLGIECAEGFIEQQHARFNGEGAAGYTLALATRELGGKAGFKAIELHQAEKVQYAGSDLDKEK